MRIRVCKPNRVLFVKRTVIHAGKVLPVDRIRSLSTFLRNRYLGTTVQESEWLTNAVT
ncbi:hypothetical protein D3C84_1218800 [compost metagenome]